MEWVATAEEYIGSFGWGARGKHLGVSRMFGEGDKASLSRNKMVAALRPRGLLSGFLAIVPGCGAVYIPPIAAKVSPQRMRLRLSSRLLSEGAVFSAYLTRDSPRRLILEDVLVWRGEAVWNTRTFSDRWNNIMNMFVMQDIKDDPIIQGFNLELANYVSLASLENPGDRHVVEFVPDERGQKRLIWMPAAAAITHTKPTASAEVSKKSMENFTARKEAGMGPDVYAVYRGDERLGLGLVRKLAISKALRSHSNTQIRAEFNKGFDKWEILEVLSVA